MTGTFPTWPVFGDDEIDAAGEVLRSGQVNYWTGLKCRSFEEAFARFVGTRFAISLANGTLALELALETLALGPGDEVIVPSRTHFSSVSSIVRRGAIPVFADVDAQSQNLNVASINRVLSSRTRAIVVVHLAGWPCDVPSILELARRRDLRVIEDCAQSHGAAFNNQKTGSFGDIGTFSFCQDKIMTTAGEGGMLVTDDEELWRRAWSLKEHGKSLEAMQTPMLGPGYRWLHERFGSNYRMAEINAAVGLRQLSKLPAWLKKRRQLAADLDLRLRGLTGIRLPYVPEAVTHAYYRYYFFVVPEQLSKGWDRDRIVADIVKQGVPCFTGACSEIYLEKAVQDTAFGPPAPLPVARQLSTTSVALQVHPTLSRSDIARVADAVELVMRRATA